MTFVNGPDLQDKGLERNLGSYLAARVRGDILLSFYRGLTGSSIIV
jgi:hypothetical protein